MSVWQKIILHDEGAGEVRQKVILYVKGGWVRVTSDKEIQFFF